MQGHHAKRVSYSDFEHWWKVTAIRLLRCRATCIYAHTMLLQRNRPPNRPISHLMAHQSAFTLTRSAASQRQGWGCSKLTCPSSRNTSPTNSSTSGKTRGPPGEGDGALAHTRTTRALIQTCNTHTHTCRNTRPETHAHATPHAQQTPEQQLSPRRRRCSSALIPPQSSKTCPPAMARQQPPIGPSSGALQPCVVRCQPPPPPLHTASPVRRRPCTLPRQCAPALAHCLASAPPSVSRLRRGSTIGDAAATVMCGRERSFGISYGHG